MIEIVEQRTRNSKTHLLEALPDGRKRYSLDCVIGRLHYKNKPTDDAEQWKDINTTIQPDGTIRAAPYDLDVFLSGMPGFHYKSKESGEFDVRIKSARSERGLLSAVIPSPKIEGNTVTWENVYPDVDVVLRAENSRVSLLRVIKSDKSPLEYDVDIQEVKGKAQLKTVQPAIDANGQLLSMEEVKIAGGRREKLRLEVAEPLGELKPIAYPIVDATTVDEDVVASGDDGWSYGSSFYNSGTFFRLGEFSGSYYDYWARFQTVTISNGATIDLAYVSMHVYYSEGGGDKSTVYAEDASNPSAPTSRADHTGRSRTSAGVNWDGISTGGYVNSPEIKTVIQELVDSYDYSGGSNAIQILIDERGSTSTQRVHGWTYDRTPSTPAKLHIEYSEGGSSIPLFMHHYKMLSGSN